MLKNLVEIAKNMHEHIGNFRKDMRSRGKS